MRPITLRDMRDRRRAIEAVEQAPHGAIVSVRQGSRTVEQNNLFWECMSDLEKAEPEGRKWTKETWRDAILHATGHAVRFEIGLDGSGAFPIGFRSSHLSKAQMSLCLEFAFAYGSKHGVVFTIDRRRYEELFGVAA